jgi:predicted amidohydrolase YtcJ
MYDAKTAASQRAYIYHTQETLNEIVTMFHKEGYQVGFHVVGDKATDMALDAIEHAMQTAPRPDPRHRLEHAVIPTAEALERIKRLGVIISTQPCWLSLFGPGFEKALGEEHMKRFMPLKTILDKGIHLAFGSDPPAVPVIEPKWGLIGATTRWTLEKRAIMPEESISMKDALRAYTMGSAYAAFEENVRGSIEPSKMADMVVWSHDLYTVPPKDLPNLRTLATMVEGQVVYKAEDTGIKF